MTHTTRPLRVLALAALLPMWAGLAQAQGAAKPAPARSADYIVAVVNNELVTQFEVDQRVARARDDAARSGAALPAPAELRKLAEQLPGIGLPQPEPPPLCTVS